jgi:hypothetical protein
MTSGTTKIGRETREIFDETNPQVIRTGVSLTQLAVFLWAQGPLRIRFRELQRQAEISDNAILNTTHAIFFHQCAIQALKQPICSAHGPALACFPFADTECNRAEPLKPS